MKPLHHHRPRGGGHGYGGVRGPIAPELAQPFLHTAEEYEWPTILDQVKEPAFVHGGDMKILRCNASYAEVARLTMAQIVGQPFWQIFPKLPGAPAGGCGNLPDEDNDNEATHEAPDGRLFVVHEIVAHRPSGRFWYCRHMLKDVTKRRHLERDLANRQEALALEKLLTDAIVESAANGYFLVDEDGRFVRWNAYMKQIIGLSESEMSGFRLLDAVHPEDRPLVQVKLLTVLATGQARMDARIGNGHGPPTFLTTARRLDVANRVYIAGFCTDITERKHSEESAAEQLSFSDVLLENMPGVFWVVDGEGSFRRWNSALNRTTGLLDSQIYNTSCLLAVTDEDRPHAARTLREALEHGYSEAVVHVITRDRGVRAFLTAKRRFSIGNRIYIAGVALDTTDQLATISALERENRTDALTGVANRCHFMHRANDEFARSRRYAHALVVWMVDLDHFKSVNDTYGHQAGDTVLQSFVSTCRNTVRDWDVIGRVGGEEFAVLLPETSPGDALAVAERLRQTVATTRVPLASGQSVSITVSIGMAAVSEADADMQAVLARADEALYQAKRTGRDKVSVAGEI
jgi:diguanylate cyclase (GGDEF)-like protein/PAS domain S-box-containing protein